MIDFAALHFAPPLSAEEREAQYQASEATRLAAKAAPKNAVIDVAGEVAEVATNMDRDHDRVLCVYLKHDQPLRAVEGEYVRALVLAEHAPLREAAERIECMAPGTRVRFTGDLRRRSWRRHDGTWDSTAELHVQSIDLDTA